MKSTKLFKLTASNVATVIFLLLLTGMMAWLITGDISRTSRVDISKSLDT